VTLAAANSERAPPAAEASGSSVRPHEELPAGDEMLIKVARARRSQALQGRDRVVSIVLGTSFVVAAVGLGFASPDHSLPRVGFLLLAIFLVTSAVEFEVGAGVAIATELAIVPMFLLLPPATVPLWIGAGVVLHRAVEFATGRLHPQRAFVLLASAWYAIGPALVLLLAGSHAPSWQMTPVYLAALGAQFGFDLASAAIRECWAHQIPRRELARTLGWAYLVDLLLAPVGFLVALRANDHTYALLILLPPALLLALLARDRQARIDRALALARDSQLANLAARRDALTGLGNRRAWDEAITLAAQARRRADTPASVILIDLNGLKMANDSFGHAVGDRLICELAAVVNASVREDGLVARVGGDEVGILLPGVDEMTCCDLVRRLRQAIDDHPRVGALRLSASVGHASWPPAESLAEALRLADERMYADKTQVKCQEVV
jgi:diguanylate cyclase (GGDEF)-like protein